MAVQGGFVNRIYLADSGDKHNIKVNESTLTLNVGGTGQLQPAGPATSIFWVRNNKNAREYGLDTRSIGVCFEELSIPDGLRAGPTYNVTVLDPGIYGSITIGATVNYQGSDAQVVSKRSEKVFPES